MSIKLLLEFELLLFIIPSSLPSQDTSKARLNLQKSANINHCHKVPLSDWTNEDESLHLWPDENRQFGIGDYLNDYTRYVKEMLDFEPLPLLIPTRPYKDELTALSTRRQVDDQVERWPCKLGTRCPKNKLQVQTRFPRPGSDWLHKWSEYMYRIGECGAMQQK